jgi:guanylate kinase
MFVGVSSQLGQLIVITGPSGVGKGTLLRSLLQAHPELHLSVSVTTRAPRPGEVEGQHYFFRSRPQFEQMVAAGQLLEWAEFAGNYYGTPRAAVEDQIRAGRWVVLEIELEGARQIRQTFSSTFSILILPPSFETLAQRLKQRGQDDEQAIARRLERAKAEMAAADEFDWQLVNDDLDTALVKLENKLLELEQIQERYPTQVNSPAQEAIV